MNLYDVILSSPATAQNSVLLNFQYPTKSQKVVFEDIAGYPFLLKGISKKQKGKSLPMQEGYITSIIVLIISWENGYIE